ncbi:Retroelement pol Polyprotein [Phytophthora palmivora]|uniref:Retroelement pol Polyprotein n=1 Tax=Phytophthora palmivora TaxID=4796 RepID=A0A2P4YFN1_9STRA|nr:Retroelement pol Polyprotein [Phytophthora palmivora]
MAVTNIMTTTNPRPRNADSDVEKSTKVISARYVCQESRNYGQSARKPYGSSSVQLDPTWTIDSECTRRITHKSQWFTDIIPSGGSIKIGGKDQVPIEGIGRVKLTVIGSNGNLNMRSLRSERYEPQMFFSLLSVPVAVKHVSNDLLCFYTIISAIILLTICKPYLGTKPFEDLTDRRL